MASPTSDCSTAVEQDKPKKQCPRDHLGRRIRPLPQNKRLDAAIASDKARQPKVDIDDKWHRQAGLWAFETCNANSWQSLTEHSLKRTAADVVFAQETRLFGSDEVAGAALGAKKHGWTASIGTASKSQAGRNSGGCAVLAAGGVGMSLGSNELVEDQFRHRIQHAWVGCAARGGIHCISLYLKDSVGIAANLELLQMAAALVKSLDGPWIIAGDFNATPQALAAANWPRILGGTIVARPTGRATTRRRTARAAPWHDRHTNCPAADPPTSR